MKTKLKMGMKTTSICRLLAVLACAGLCALPQIAGAQGAPAAAPQGAQAGPGGPGGPPPGDPLGPDLYMAIHAGNDEAVHALLAKGAQTEARNWLGFTPLLWAVARGNQPACEALIMHKADINCDSNYGGVLEFAAMGDNPTLLKYLFDHGARFSTKRSDKITALMGASDHGNPEIVRIMLAHKPDIGAEDLAGMTALSHAARHGHSGAVSLLLEAVAAVNVMDAEGRSPLMHAAMNGHADTVRMLAAHGAKVNDRDTLGNTALILAARYCGEPAVAAALLKAGADASIRDSHGHSAAEIAGMRGFGAFATALDPHSHVHAAAANSWTPERAAKAATTSLSLIERTTHNFSAHAACGSCHHQGLGLLTTGTAASLGFPIDQEIAKSERAAALAETVDHIDDLRKLLPHPEMYKYFPAVDMDEFSPFGGVALTALASHGAPGSEAIEGIATINARQQEPDGGWGFGFHREPLQSSRFSSTAYALAAMKVYGPKAMAGEWTERRQKALAWLGATPARTNEDLAFRLLALKWADAPRAEIDTAAADLRKRQHRDGGWSQFEGDSPAGAEYNRSDAYATGEALYALHVGGDAPATDAAYKRGVTFLLNAQDEDGSWFVNKRAVFANNYFDTGFPHGESQYISYSATCWSAMALMFAARPHGQTHVASAR
ncbi:MAG TPA: ankyrin repeat domain-containing protein [Chthonomonadaceae bacterium]|nr:ankyrin repeat domain-containing protein [Chthonomonadaceae bacterium]